MVYHSQYARVLIDFFFEIDKNDMFIMVCEVSVLSVRVNRFCDALEIRVKKADEFGKCDLFSKSQSYG